MRTILRWFLVAGFALFFTGLGVWIGTSGAGPNFRQQALPDPIAHGESLSARSQKLFEHPAIREAVGNGEEVEIVEISPGAWLLHLPVGNTVLSESEAGPPDDAR